MSFKLDVVWFLTLFWLLRTAANSFYQYMKWNDLLQSNIFDFSVHASTILVVMIVYMLPLKYAPILIDSLP